jgi:hypothetical protein
MYKPEIEHIGDTTGHIHHNNLSHIKDVYKHTKVVFRAFLVDFSAIFFIFLNIYANPTPYPSVTKCYCKEMCKSGLKLEGQWHERLYLSFLGWQGFPQPSLHIRPGFLVSCIVL